MLSGDFVRQQRTLRNSVSFRGIGVHTGKLVSVNIRPSPVDTGISILRTDIDEEIFVHPRYTVSSPLCTTIVNDNGAKVRTVEHLLATMYAMQIDNAAISIDADEIPILDGSAAKMVDLFVDTIEQDKEKRLIKIDREIEYEDGNRSVKLIPNDKFVIEVTCDYSDRGLPYAHYTYTHSPENFKKEIAYSRTFGFLEDVEAIRSRRLALGASLDNTVIFDKGVCLNEGGLRSPNEYITHKILDVIGDLSVIGAEIQGKFIGVRPGHAMNGVLVKTLDHIFN